MIGCASARDNGVNAPCSCPSSDPTGPVCGPRRSRALAGLLLAQRAVIVEADADGYPDPLRPVGGSQEQRVAEVAHRSGLGHHRDREIGAVEGVGRAFREPDHATQVHRRFKVEFWVR